MKRGGATGIAGAAALAAVLALLFAGPARAAVWEGESRALALDAGATYIGEKVRFLLASYLVNFDPAAEEFGLPAFDPWHFWVGFSLGEKVNHPEKLMASVVAFGQYHMRYLDSARFHPFLGAGIGLVYTEYRVRHQPLNLDFNPNLGVGFDVGSASSPDFAVSLRWHHISNANIRPPNNGVNSVVLGLSVPLH
jgi:hypothetical protein